MLLVATGGRIAYSSERPAKVVTFQGFRTLLAGVLPPPGTYFKESAYFYTGNAQLDGAGRRIEANLQEYLPIQFSMVNQVTKTKLWGSDYSWVVIVPLAEPS